MRPFFLLTPLTASTRLCLGELPSCAWRALQLYFAAWFDGREVVPGAIDFVQTAGEFPGWNPHLHVVLTDGGWLPDGTFRHLLAFDSSAVEKLFRAEVLRLLMAGCKIREEVVENLLTWRRSGFSVHAGARVEERAEAAGLGRYGILCPLVFDRLEWDETSGKAEPPVVLGGAFLIDFASLGRLLSHLGSAPQLPEPLAQSPPGEMELYVSHA